LVPDCNASLAKWQTIAGFRDLSVRIGTI